MGQGSCIVTLEDGTRCPKERGRRRTMCSTHRWRHERYGDPLFKIRRNPAEVRALLDAAAVAVTDECVIFETGAPRPYATLDGAHMPAARAVYILAHGADSVAGLDVCHTCNGGSGEHGCINIRHLVAGTPTRNADDMMASGRYNGNGDPQGEANGRAVLDEPAVRVIRDLYATGETTLTALALEFGVSPKSIGNVVNRVTWSHVE